MGPRPWSGPASACPTGSPSLRTDGPCISPTRIGTWCGPTTTTLDTGEPANERVFLDFADLPGRPDGACVDEDGGYWIACVYGSAVLRVTPDGSVDRHISLPVAKPTMPAFGGPDLATLFITTIGGGGSHAVDPSQPDAGGLFAVETGVRGQPEPPFAGGGAGWPA